MDNGTLRFEEILQLVQMFHSRSDMEAPYTIAEKTKGYLTNATLRRYNNELHSSEVMLQDIMKQIIIDHS